VTDAPDAPDAPDGAHPAAPAEAPAPSNNARFLALAQRAWMALLHAALVLPFVTTRACQNGEVSSYTGFAYYFGADRLPFGLALIGIVALFVLVPWTGARTLNAIAALGLRAWVAGMGALLAVVGPFLAFLFDSPEPKVGWYVHGAGWLATALGYTVVTAALLTQAPPALDTRRTAERWGVLALSVAPVVAVLLKMLVAPEKLVGALLVGVGIGYTLTLPLALAGGALVRAIRRDEPVLLARVVWWWATCVTLLGHLLAGLAD